MTARLVRWALPLATLAVWLWIMLGIGQPLRAAGEGLLPFDLRAGGYSLAEARAYLRALSPAGYALYQGPLHLWDTVLPALLGLTLAWWMRPFRGVFGMVCVLAAMSYVALDWGENAAVGRLLEAGPDWIELAVVERASAFTQGKFAALALAALLALRQSLRRGRGTV